MTLEETSYFTVISPAAAILAGPTIAWVVNIVGSKTLLVFLAVPQGAAWFLIMMANNIYVLYASRFISGIGDAMLFNALPMYIGEISTPEVRGSWGNLFALSFNLGQVVINVVGGYCGVKMTACIFFGLPMVQLLASLVLPHTPHFLIGQKRVDEARTSLQTLRWNKNVDQELLTIKNDVNRQISGSSGWSNLFTKGANRRALIIAIGIRGVQQFSGLPAFSFYTQYLFDQCGSNLSGRTSAIIYTGALMIATSSFSLIVNRLGRRPMIIFSTISCTFCVLAESIYFYVYEKTDIDTSSVQWIPLTGLLLYLVCCAAGLGIIPTLMLGELFSSSIKSKALCVSNMFFSVCLLSCSKLFQSLSSGLGFYVPFALFTVCCCFGTAFCYYYVPETKGKSLEEIQQDLAKAANVRS